MPFIEVMIAEGRPPEKVRGLMRALHNAAVDAFDVDPSSVRVVVREVPPDHWQAGGVTISERLEAKSS